VLCSRNAPHIGHIPNADVYFGGWHSPKEKEILAWLLEKKRRVIACFAWDIESAAAAVPGLVDALEENRMLILEMRNRDGDLAAAEQRNRFVIEHSDTLFVPHTTPGGMLDKLLKETRK
jgi:predicted TIM-barrel fold metal-dependent hydrolase